MHDGSERRAFGRFLRGAVSFFESHVMKAMQALQIARLE